MNLAGRVGSDLQLGVQKDVNPAVWYYAIVSEAN